MQFSSLHTHTLFCDGRDDVETMCRAAFAKGLVSVGFSAHGPVYRKTGIKTDWNLDDDRVGEYLDEVRAARLRWKGKIAVYLGLEVDYIKGMCSAMDRDIRALGLDFIIGSAHFLVPENGARPFTIDGPAEELEAGIRDGFGGDGEALMNAYWDALAEMIALGGFDILGHADLVKKNNRGGRLFSMESESWTRRLRETARAAGESGCVVEINTGQINRRHSAETSPSLSFMRLLRERNVPVVITADAHCADDLDGNYATACRVLEEAGYTSHALFEGREAGIPLWRSEKLNEENCGG